MIDFPQKQRKPVGFVVFALPLLYSQYTYVTEAGPVIRTYWILATNTRDIYLQSKPVQLTSIPYLRRMLNVAHRCNVTVCDEMTADSHVLVLTDRACMYKRVAEIESGWSLLLSVPTANASPLIPSYIVLIRNCT